MAKVSIIGCGNVGMRYAYALMIKALAREIVLVDADRKRVEGEVMDLCHGEPYTAPIDVRAGDYADVAGSTLVVITAGRKQRPGQTRPELACDNVELYRTIVPQVMRHAPQALFLIVTNPVDVLAYAAYKISGKPAHEVIGSGTVLDTARFRFLLAHHCQVDARNIHAYILGEHGDSEFAAWSKAMVGGILFKEYCYLCKKSNHTCNPDVEFNKIFTEVRDSAYKIIERKGETSYGIGLAMARITQAVVHDENAVLPVSSLVQDYYGARGIYLSLPAVVNRSGVRELLNIGLDADEQKALQHSAAVIKEMITKTGI